jgi:hypothetical protein
MKKLLIIFACTAFFGCTNPEHTVDDPADSAGLKNYSEESTPNSNPGPTSDQNTQGQGLDTSAAPKDTSRAMRH